MLNKQNNCVRCNDGSKEKKTCKTKGYEKKGC